MIENEIKMYQKYIKIKSKDKVSFINRIRFWKLLKNEYEYTKKENTNKQDRIIKYKKYISILETRNLILEQQVKQLESDLKKKKSRKKK